MTATLLETAPGTDAPVRIHGDSRNWLLCECCGEYKRVALCEYGTADKSPIHLCDSCIADLTFLEQAAA